MEFDRVCKSFLHKKYILFLFIGSFSLGMLSCSPAWIEIEAGSVCRDVFRSFTKPKRGCMIYAQARDKIWIVEYRAGTMFYCLDEQRCEETHIQMPQPPQGENEDVLLLFPPLTTTTPTRSELASQCKEILLSTQGVCWRKSPQEEAEEANCWSLLRLFPTADRREAKCQLEIFSAP